MHFQFKNTVCSKLLVFMSEQWLILSRLSQYTTNPHMILGALLTQFLFKVLCSGSCFDTAPNCVCFFDENMKFQIQSQDSLVNEFQRPFSALWLQSSPLGNRVPANIRTDDTICGKHGYSCVMWNTVSPIAGRFVCGSVGGVGLGMRAMVSPIRLSI